MSIQKVLDTYNASDNTELEMRFVIRDKSVFKNLISSIDGDRSVEQSINLITPAIPPNNNTPDRIYTVKFVNGKKTNMVYMRKNVIARTRVIGDLLAYRLNVSSEEDIPKFNANLSKFARVKLRLSIRPPAFDDWRIDLTLVKTVNNIKNDLTPSKKVMLFPINVDRFVEEAPWNHAECELEIEHIRTDDTKAVEAADIQQLYDYIASVMDPSHKDTFEYQKHLYSIAKIVKPKHANAFKKYKGVRDLYNRVFELNRAKFYEEVFPKMQNFILLDKADGVRNLIYIKGSNAYCLNGGLRTIPLAQTYEHEAIFDAEHITDGDTDMYYVFDVLAIDGKSIVDLPTSERVGFIPNVVEMAGPRFVAKGMTFLTADYKEEHLTRYTADKPYDVDGFVYTPQDSPYFTMRSWKWKPLKHMSIDFLIKEIPPNLINVHPYIEKPGHTMLLLFVGINKRLFDKLRLTLIPGYKKMFPGQTTHKYFPIQFCPSDDPFAYVYYHPDNHKYAVSDIIDRVCELRRVELKDTDAIAEIVAEAVDEAGEAGEAGAVTERKGGGTDLSKRPYTWHMMKIRTDRDLALKKGTYFGNDFYIAEYTWQNYSSPLLFDDLIISHAEYADMGYFKEVKSQPYKAMTAMNSFAKSTLLAPYKKSSWLVDLAAGRGADMFRVSDARIKNALFLDSDSQALSTLISRKHDFQRGIKRLNTRIYTKIVDLKTDYKETVESIDAVGIPVGSIDVIMCNFAMHYFTGTPQNVRNIVQLVKSLLKKGGSFFFTAFQGSEVFELLKDQDKWDVRVGEVLKYSIVKNYTAAKLQDTGQQIDVLLPFSAGKYYTEYLVNFKYVAKEFTKQGFKKTDQGGFGAILPQFQQNNRKMYGLLTENDKKFNSLYGYMVFTKK
jgi:hypothetical protein